MREILFRGKCVEFGIYHKQWLEGFYGEDNDKAFIVRNTDFGMAGYFCDSNTIGQYTGLKDKNGKRIFEGDIVEHERHMHIVAYNDEYAGFWPFYDQDHPAGYGVIGEESEVIGNIHDNPELLEGEDNG